MSDTQPPSIVDPVESQRLQAACDEYLKVRARHTATRALHPSEINRLFGFDP